MKRNLIVTCWLLLYGSMTAGAAPCSIDTSTTINGDVTLGTGCAVYTITNGVVITVTNAKRVEIAAASVQVTANGTATIRARGAKGAEGPQGGDGDGYPFWDSDGKTKDDKDYWNAVDDAKKPRSTNRCIGRVGNKGKQGSRGADIAVPAAFTVGAGTLVFDDHGGDGGAGGAGGRGTTLRNRRQNYCNGCMYTCNPGPQGPTGDAGADGSIYVGTVVRASGTLTLKH